MAALITAPIVGAVIYALVLASQTSGLSGGPTLSQIIGTAVGVGIIALVFLVLAVLPFSLLVRKNPRFRAIVLAVGVTSWFGLSVLAFVLMGQGADVAASTSAQLLTVGVPMLLVFVALIDRGPHA